MISGRMLVLHLGPVWLAFKRGRGLWGLRIGPWCFGRTGEPVRRRWVPWRARRWHAWRAGAYVKERQARVEAGRRSFAALAALGLPVSSCPICQAVEVSPVDSAGARRCLKCGYTAAGDFFDREFWQGGAGDYDDRLGEPGPWEEAGAGPVEVP